MKTKNLFLIPALIAGLGLLPEGLLTAQTFTTLHSFAGSDGNSPSAGLILSNSTLFGTTCYGGDSDNGTVFAVNTDGTRFTNLHSFTGGIGGANPRADLVVSGGALYGTAIFGGSGGGGTVFALRADGTGFTNLHGLSAFPEGAVVLSGDTLYGTTHGDGSSTHGSVFAIHTDGRGFTNLHTCEYGNDARGLRGRLILSGNTLYGTAELGGDSDIFVGSGVVFALHTDGTGFTNLHSFAALPNSDGAYPDGGLVLSGNKLYGTATTGNNSGNGAVYSVNTNGTGFTILHEFSSTPPWPGPFTNSDGANPTAGLFLSGDSLYGTTSYGGSSGNGTVFAVHTDGTGFKNLYSFSPLVSDRNSDGAEPRAGLILSGNTLYGTTQSGGSSGNGTVFSLSFRPQLTITPSGTNVMLTWPTNVAGFDYTGYTLQSAPALTGPFTNLPAATNPYTNPITGAQKFYRLGQ